MKHLLLITCLMLTLSSCKKDKDETTPTTYELKIVASGTSYGITIRDMETAQQVLFTQTNQSGNKTYTVTMDKDVVVYYTTTADLDLKLYVNGTLKSDHGYSAGNGGISVLKP